MMPLWKSLTKFGNKLNAQKHNGLLQLYFILGSIILIAFYIIYTNVLLQKAKQDSEFIPRSFAKYIVFIEAQINEAEGNSKLISELFAKYINSLTKDNYEDVLVNYIRDEFIANMKMPVIITDDMQIPLYWKNLDVPEAIQFKDLNTTFQTYILNAMQKMEIIPLIYEGKSVGFVYYRSQSTFQDFVQQVQYPIIVTDEFRKPRYWRNMGILENMSYDNLNDAHKQFISKRMNKMVEFPLETEEKRIGFVYFEESDSLKKIRSLVYVEILLIILFVAFGSYGFLMIKNSEKNTLWVGLAKETAHQFGTPITSLKGWTEYLKMYFEDSPQSEEVSPMLVNIEEDVGHLQKIASRFGKVGSSITLKPTKVQEVIEETVNYFETRLPHFSSRIEITFKPDDYEMKVLMDKELFQWTLENLIKNSIDAMTDKGGEISIAVARHKDNVNISISDQGKGIPKGMVKKIFDPGFTTKTRGWGLGLSLVKRIIEEFHKGSIRVAETSPKGTTFEITLKEFV
ncbi:MAG: HAMP domain-containing histidine kinase [Candidatus Cloacimonetes bacterium]|nr:HAMP domain-containing histidine kinase [Candidatus Cloacimonadota bacterium]